MLSETKTTTAPSVAPVLAEHEQDHHLESADIVRIAFVALACAVVWFRVWEPFERSALSD